MSAAPWFEPPAPPLRPGDRAVVVGAGLAGAHCAYYLAQRGVKVTVFDAASCIAAAASGNPAGVLLPFLSRGKDDSSFFLDQAYGFACQSLAHTEVWRQPICDRVVQLLDQSRLRRFYESLAAAPQPYVAALNPAETARFVGLELRQPSLLLQRARALDPARLCRQRLDHENIQVVLEHQVECLVPEVDGWSLWSRDRMISRAPVVVLANAHAARTFSHTSRLPLSAHPGQLALLDEARLPCRPKAVICYQDYLVPGVSGQLLVGASWREQGSDLALSPGEQELLVARARDLLPAMALPHDWPLRGRVGVRATTPDHLPLVGPVPDIDAFQEAYGDLHLGRAHAWPAAPCFPGLYASLGHGARGLLTTPLAGWLLASIIVAGPLPDSRLLTAVHPGRYTIRHLRRHPTHRKSDIL